MKVFFIKKEALFSREVLHFKNLIWAKKTTNKKFIFSTYY